MNSPRKNANTIKTGAGQIFSLPRTDDFSRRRTTKLLTAKVVSTMAFQNKIKNLSCTHKNSRFSMDYDVQNYSII